MQLSIANQVCDKGGLDEGVPWRSAKDGPYKKKLHTHVNPYKVNPSKQRWF